jgi:CRISPR-associated protein Csb1
VNLRSAGNSGAASAKKATAKKHDAVILAQARPTKNDRNADDQLANLEDSKMTTISLEALSQAVGGTCAAIRCCTRLQPAGGFGDKVFPPTFIADDKQSPLKYAHEKRRINGQDIPVVLLDSVASQANRKEEALLAAWETKQLNFPVIGVDFAGEVGMEDLGFLTALQAPHRIADALLRDALWHDEVGQRDLPFRESPEGQAYTAASFKSATAVYRLCPTALVFGVWDSTGPRGGLGAKFQRALVSEIVGVGFLSGVKTGSRIDPAGIQSNVGVYHLASDPSDWTADIAEAQKDKKGEPIPFSRSGAEGKGKPSSVNHSNVAPTKDDTAGGVTFDYALQTTVLSLPALRRLRFPVDVRGTVIPPEKRLAAENAARTALAALALAAVAFERERGYDLRSRSLLVPETASPLAFEFLPAEGGSAQVHPLDTAGAIALLAAAHEQAKEHGFEWQRQPLKLMPMPKLVSLIRESRRLAARNANEDAVGVA